MSFIVYIIGAVIFAAVSIAAIVLRDSQNGAVRKNIRLSLLVDVCAVLVYALVDLLVFHTAVKDVAVPAIAFAFYSVAVFCKLALDGDL